MSARSDEPAGEEEPAARSSAADSGDPGGTGPGGAPHGAHRSYAGRGWRGWHGSLGERWRLFRGSLFFPAVVVMLILAAGAGLFAGSYTYALADPTPRRIPTAVVGIDEGSPSRQAAFIEGLERALDTSLKIYDYPTYASAREAVKQQKVFAVLYVPERGGIQLDVSGASGASVAELLAKAAPAVGAKAGVPVVIKDLTPLQKGDPRGLALFYISLAAVVVGFVGAIQLGLHARDLNPAERIAFTAGYALLGGFAIAAVVDWWLEAVDLPFVESWMILALTMFTSGMVFTMFNTLFGKWAVIPTWGLMVVLGNPSSGGAVSWPLLPSVFGFIGRWLPPGASVNAQHAAVYFGDHQSARPFLVLGAWALGSAAVFLIWRHRHPGGRPASVSAEADSAAAP
ncbi:ABC transporter permease [Streptomyces sp. 8N706]|uniref:ABC transporter permease n=1 Tax=Streptomyces sp. 8N706 TaxID=3457416 RepID=UPI003FD44BCB